MKVFVGLFACLVAVQAQPLFGLDTLTGDGGSNPTSAITSLGSRLGGGTGLPLPSLPDFSSIFSKVFSGSDGAAAFPKVLAAFKDAFNVNPNGAIPIDSFKSTFNNAAKNDPAGFPFNVLNNILGNFPGLGGAGGAGGANDAGGFLDIFTKFFGSDGTIPAGVTSKFSDLFSQGDITPAKFASVFNSCPLASGLNAGQSNSDNHSDSLDYKHDESTSLSKKSADESNDASSFSLN